MADIVRRKDLERASGGGIFAWGIGNSVGPAIKYAKHAERIQQLEALFTPMKSRAKAIDSSPTSIVLWLGYHNEFGSIEPLPRHIVVTSRAHSLSGEEKRGHYALICHSDEPLGQQKNSGAIDGNSVRNLVSSNPVGASQVTSVVRYNGEGFFCGEYPIVFRATLINQAFVRLAAPIVLEGKRLDLYREVCAARTVSQWLSRVDSLKTIASPLPPTSAQARLF